MTTTTLEPPIKDELKHLTVAFEVKAVDEEAGTFTGLAATWDLDQGGDVIVKGAFKRTIQSWKKAKNKKHNLLDSHDRSSIFSVLGELKEAQETDQGVEATFSFLEGERGQAARALVQAGNVTSLSIGYRAIQVKSPDTEQQKQGIYRFIQELKWQETSLVLFPMNEAAVIDLATVKGMLDSAVAEPGSITTEDLTSLQELHKDLTSYLEKVALASANPPTPSEWAPGSPRRLALEANLRSIRVRALSTPS